MLMRLVWLSLGMFAIGSELFMIAGLLPLIAMDTGVSVAGAGQLLTLSSLVYALSSPVTATLTAGFDRRRVLLGSLAGFLLACLMAAASTGFAMLAGARVLLALSAGLFSPAALAFAGAYAALEQRGRALAVVVGGVSTAVALGAPLGTLIGTGLGWRFTFLAVAGLAAAAWLGIALRLPGQPSAPGISLGDRLRTAMRRDVALALLTTLFWGMGGFAVYTYTAPLMQSAAGWQGARVGVVLLAFGLGAVAGTALGGALADRVSPARLQRMVLLALIALNGAISLTALLLDPSWAAALALTVIYAAWGVAGWMFHPPQQVRLMNLAPRAVPVALSLNQSAMYLGMAAGGITGGLTLRLGSPAYLGWAGAACQLAALGVLILGLRIARVPSATGTPAPEQRAAPVENPAAP